MNHNNMHLRYIGDPILNKKSEEVNELTPGILEFSEKLIKKMYEYEGIGLAAPQVGINKRVIALSLSSEHVKTPMSPGEAYLLPQMPIALFNPVISGIDNETVFWEEGCLSIPEIFMPVERYKSINLSAELRSGENINIYCDGFMAGALQHEVDHLNGILFVDRLSVKNYKKVKSKISKLKKQL